MHTPEDTDLATLVGDLRRQMAQLEGRVTELERLQAAAIPPGEVPAPGAPLQAHAAAPPDPVQPPPAARPGVSDEDMVYIAAAVAAYLGVRARIRQVRLVQSAAWAQVGRATIHASHRVH